VSIIKADLIRRHKLLTFGIFLIVILGVAVFYRNAILISLGEYLITEDPLKKSDAIVVLSGSIPDRILEAIDIYKQGYAPLIILTKQPELPGYNKLLRLGIKIPEEHDLNQMIALELGVPSSSLITLDKRCNSTYSEAQVLYDFLKKRNLKSVILVTSKHHSTRAAKTFNYITSGGIKVISRPSKYDDFDPRSWWKNDWRVTALEYEKLALHYLMRLVL
jgi:uncharacterized SAM-binding protein YcdF (DUF218 family)